MTNWFDHPDYQFLIGNVVRSPSYDEQTRALQNQERQTAQAQEAQDSCDQCPTDTGSPVR